jgi:CRP/FNR family transcriptional regulator, cyclic AMP receptor protein
MVSVSGDTAAGPDAPRPRDRGGRGVRLLEADPDLGAGLGDDELDEARRYVVLPTLALESGPWRVPELEATHGVRGEVRGFLVLSGAVTVELAIAVRRCVRLLTPGELVLLDGWAVNSMPVQTGWAVVDPATVAIFDERLLVIASRWPGLMSQILKRAAQQVRHALLQQAISQLPRVEDRLLGLLWSIADRQGVVRSDGIWVHLPVTHATLAQMIGARRPTVSLGLRTLGERGLAVSEGDGWLLSPDSLELFEPGSGPAHPA